MNNSSIHWNLAGKSMLLGAVLEPTIPVVFRMPLTDVFVAWLSGLLYGSLQQQCLIYKGTFLIPEIIANITTTPCNFIRPFIGFQLHRLLKTHK